jgi:hypothetical protein
LDLRISTHLPLDEITDDDNLFVVFAVRSLLLLLLQTCTGPEYMPVLDSPNTRCRHTHAGQQKLASAFQSVDIDQNPLKSPEATAFHWDASRSTLFSAGGVLPSTVFAWDLRHETIYTTFGEEHQMLSSYQSPSYSIRYLQVRDSLAIRRVLLLWRSLVISI